MRERVLLRLYRLFFQKNKTIAVFTLAGVGVLGVLSVAHAGFGDSIADIVGGLVSSLAQLVIELVGKLFVVLIDILLAVVQYNDFINAPAVVKAWVLIRDFANMAFLIIFIAIAFATILGVEKYEYKQLLPKLLFMAVAINFSRTICGLVLDAAQVVMMTFVNGFKDVAAGNLIRGFGLTDLLTLNSTASAADGRGVDNTSLAIASVLAVVILVISAIVVGVIVFMFLIRVIYLWILIILSPLAFLMAATPGMSGKFSEWWGQFVKYAMVGPILAFFLWLSFSIMAAVKPTQNLAISSGFSFSNPDQSISAAITNISSSQNLLSFAIAIALLVMSLTVAQSLGVKGGQLAGAALSKIQSGGVKLAKLGALGFVTGGAGLAAYGAYRGGKGAYKAGKKLAGTEVGKMVLEDLDRKVGSKIVAKAARIAGRVPLLPASTRKRLIAFQNPATGARIGKFKETWMQRRKEEREEGTLVKEAQNRDAYNLHYHGIKTDYAGQAMAGLVEKRAKEHAEISMDEDSIVSRMDQAQKDMDNAKASAKDPEHPTAAEAQAIRKASIEVMALEKLVTRNNAQNAALGKQFAQGNVTPELIAAMGEVDKKPENMANYLETFHGATGLSDQIEKIKKIEDEDERKKQLEAITAALIAQFRNTEEGKGASDTDMKKIVGNRLYAKKYRVFDEAKKSQWEGKTLEMGENGQMYVGGVNENEFLSTDVMRSGRGVDEDKETGKIADRDAYQGTADILHWQQWQKQLHEGLAKTTGIDQYDLKFERDLGVDAMKANNLSFAFTVKEMTVDATDANGNKIRKQVLEKIDTSNAGDLKLHDNLFGGKLATGSIGDAAKQHPMTSHQQTFSGGRMYISTKAPSWGDQMIQATAGGDSRALSSERVDSSLALVNLRREDLHYPLSEEQKKNYALSYYRRHNPKNGIVSRLPQGNFAVRGCNLLKVFNIDGVSQPSDVADYYRKLGLEYGAPVKEDKNKAGSESEADNEPKIIVPNSVRGNRRTDAEQAESQRIIRESQGPGGGNPPV